VSVPKSPPTHLLIRLPRESRFNDLFRDTVTCGEPTSECARTTTMRRYTTCSRCLEIAKETAT